MSIRVKLIVGYLVVAMLVGGVGLVSYQATEEISVQFDDISDEMLPVIGVLEALESDAWQVIAAANAAGLVASKVSTMTDDAAAKRELEEELSEEHVPHYRTTMKRLVDLAQQHAPEYDKFLGEITKTGDQLLETSESFVQLNLSGAPTLEILEAEEELERVQEAFLDTLKPMLEHEQEELQELKTELQHIIHEAVEQFLFYGISAFVAAIVLGLLISQKIASPLIRLTGAMTEVGKTKFETRVEITSKDEVGVLSKGFNEMAETLSRTTVSKDYFENIVNSMNSSLIVLDAEGRIREVNQTTCYFLGYKAEELEGQSLDLVLDFRDFVEEDAVDPLSFLGFVNNVEINFIGKNGEKVPVMLSGSTMGSDDGKIGGYVCVAQSISELKRLEKTLKVSSGAPEHHEE